MDIHEAIAVVQKLAGGTDPDRGDRPTGADDLEQPDTIRALHLALEVMRERARRPTNSGRPWTVEHEARIAAGHAEGRTAAELARTVGRTSMAVQARLVRLGLLDADDAGSLRFPV